MDYRRGLSTKDYLHWRGFMSSIPTNWKHILSQGFDRNKCIAKGFIVQNNGETHVDTLSTKMIYQIFIHRFREVPTSQKKYIDVFNMDDDEWSGIYYLPLKACAEVRTRTFQYKNQC